MSLFNYIFHVITHAKHYDIKVLRFSPHTFHEPRFGGSLGPVEDKVTRANDYNTGMRPQGRCDCVCWWGKVAQEGWGCC